MGEAEAAPQSVSIRVMEQEIDKSKFREQRGGLQRNISIGQRDFFSLRLIQGRVGEGAKRNPSTLK